jgi:hypothetical protein
MSCFASKQKSYKALRRYVKRNQKPSLRAGGVAQVVEHLLLASTRPWIQAPVLTKKTSLRCSNWAKMTQSQKYFKIIKINQNKI